jgi:uncharacterized protein (UPF0332 family)
MEEQNYEEFYRKVSEHILELYVLPEVKRRQEEGGLETPVELHASQVIFYSDKRKPGIRINSEVKALAKMKLKPGVSKEPGEPVFENELEGLEELHLTKDEDPDCGHATLLKLNDRWLLAFDFIYNKGLAGKHIQAARQFVEVAKFSLEEHLWSAFVDNLFSAAELSAKALLLALIPDARFREKATHRAIHRRYNRFAHLGNVDSECVQVFNELSKLRYPARYLEADFSISEDEASNLVETVSQMIEDASQVVVRSDVGTLPS